MQDFTDSYCERCGTRYTFGPPPPKGRSIATARVLARGLKHFVMNDSSTIDDAMAAARIDEERTTAAQVTEEFHKVFSFCMTCRQYACEKCWNPNQSACLSCAPLWDTEPVAPEGHLIIRTPTARTPAPQDSVPVAPEPDLDEVLRRRSADLAAADAGSRTAGEIRREARRDQKAAEQLRTQSESWKTQDDGWTLWPAEEPPAGSPPASSPPAGSPPAGSPPAGDMSLTADELLLVQAELDTPPYQEPDEPQPRRRSSGKRAATPPETPLPSADFDLLGSLREPAEGVPQSEIAQPAAGARRAPALGRLLGGQKPASEASGRGGRSTPSKPARAGKAGKSHGSVPAGSGELWPHATPWSERPIARHDWGAEADDAQAVAEPQPAQAAFEDETVEAPGWEEPVRWPEPAAPPAPEPAAPLPAQLPLSPTLPPAGKPARAAQADPEFAQSPAAWLAAAKRSEPPQPEPRHRKQSRTEPEPELEPRPEPESAAPEPEPAPPPTLAPSTSWEPTPRPEQPPAWQPIGARWTPRPSEQAAWSPSETDVAASMAARNQLDQAAEEEAARVAAMWAESAQRVIDRGSARVCYRCSLPLSTHARYCRRCGTNQQG